MADQWYLDLDGVRSGPYQQSEILSLIAEGEVLPHHRVATHLKDAHWVTILDWRLAQAQSSHKSYTPPVSPVIIEEAPPQIATPVPPPKKVTTEHTNPEIIPGPKRDPMAEMFDLLQSNKQKREAKVQAHAQLASLEASASPNLKKATREGSSRLRMGLIAVGTMVLGFSLAQLLKQTETTPSAPEANSKSEKPSAPTPATNPEPSTTEIVDRSNDKITIKATVEKPLPEKPIEKKVELKPLTPKATARTVITPIKEPDKKIPDHELEELRNLKKELLELKAMKDQMKSEPMMDDADPSDPASGGALGPDGAPLDPYDPAATGNPNVAPGDVTY